MNRTLVVPTKKGPNDRCLVPRHDKGYSLIKEKKGFMNLTLVVPTKEGPTDASFVGMTKDNLSQRKKKGLRNVLLSSRRRRDLMTDASSSA